MTRPLLVLLPGFDGTGRLFAPLLAALGEDWEAMVVSYPALTTPDAHCELIESRLPRDRPLVVIAESFSGPIALQLIRRANADYRAAVLSTTFARPPLGLVVSLAHKLRLAAFVNPAVNEQILRLFCLNGVSDLALIRDIVGVVRGIDRAVVSSRFQTLTQMDASGWLSATRLPALVLTAQSDRIVRRRFADSLLQNLPDVTHVEAAGPHLLLQAAASACAEKIKTFLQSRVELRPN